MPTTRNSLWLHRAYYQETLKVYAKVWDIYIKFYTVFLTANVAGLGIALKYLSQHERIPVAAIFILENVVTTGTSWWVAKYSAEIDDKLRSVSQSMLELDTEVVPISGAILESPVARNLSVMAGRANCVACMLHIGFWIAICLVSGLPDSAEGNSKPPVIQCVATQTTPTAAQSDARQVLKAPQQKSQAARP